MNATYALWLSDPTGQPLALIDNYLWIDYGLAVDNVGAMVLSLPPDFSQSYLKIDGRLELYRRVDLGPQKLEGETVWLIRVIDHLLNEDGTRSLVLTAFTANELLTRRVVAYNAGDLEAELDGPVDDLMTNLVIQNLGTDADNSDYDTESRDVSTYLSVATSPGIGAELTKSVAWRNLFEVLRELYESSTLIRNATHFDIVQNGPGALQFRTYSKLRGRDHSATGLNLVTLSDTNGTIVSGRFLQDYSTEVTAGYGGWPGAELSGDVPTRIDTDRLRRSPFGRREAYASGGSSEGIDAGRDEAAALVRQGRPVELLEVVVRDTPQYQRGVHWDFGDAVEVQFAGINRTATVDAIQVRVENKVETTRVILRTYSVVTGLLLLEDAFLLLLENSDFLELENI